MTPDTKAVKRGVDTDRDFLDCLLLVDHGKRVLVAALEINCNTQHARMHRRLSAITLKNKDSPGQALRGFNSKRATYG